MARIRKPLNIRGFTEVNMPADAYSPHVAKRHGVRQSSAALESPKPFRAEQTEKLATVNLCPQMPKSFGLGVATGEILSETRTLIATIYAGESPDKKAVRHHLTRIAAICEAWDKHLNS